MKASTLPITLAALGAIALSACSSSSSDDPFLGTYDYMESNTFTITAPMATPPVKGTATGTLTIGPGQGADDVVTIDGPPDAGGAACALTASRSGATLTFAAGQSCAVSGMGATGTATLKSGSGSLAGTTLTLDLSYDIAGMSPQGSFSATTVDHDTATKQ